MRRTTFRRLSALVLLATAAPIAAQTVGSGVAPFTKANSAERPIRFAATPPADATLVVLTRGSALPAGLRVDAATRGQIERAVAGAEFKGKANAKLWVNGAGPNGRVLLVGLGDAPDAKAMMEAAGTAAQEVAGHARPIALVADAGGAALADVALGYGLGQYRFDRYKTAGFTAPASAPVTIVGADAGAGERAYAQRHSAMVEAVRLSRDLANEPANVVYPATFVERTRAAFAGVPGVTIEVLDEAQMRAMNMGAIVGVGQGSPRGSRMMVVRYRGAGAKAGGPLALVGKGITFDSGGISLKPGAGMGDMKGDMSGAASVVGAVLSLAKSGAPVDVVGVAALAENMPDGNAHRPGDVIRTMSGKTIEVINTDAEGRLVLADGVEHVAKAYRPRAIVTMATLTGAIVGALDDEYAGLFARDEALGAALLKAGDTSGEAVWRMPLHPNYEEVVKSEIADVRNSTSPAGPGAGTGATFIGFFVDKAMPWAHVDIAGVNQDVPGPLTPKGMTGYGVRLLDALARGY